MSEFHWGVATAAYQIEGSATADGRRPSIWDRFSHTPGRVQGGDTGDVAVDHYRRWQSDLELLSHLGVDAYRFSVSWPRVIGAHGRVNPLGIDFYDRLVDGLLDRGIDPVLTLYHWDLPQDLEDRGGWANRDTAFRFADYAGEVARRLGDRIELWGTLNEPWCAAFLGYASGVHAPGRQEPQAALAAAHHLNLAHGLASRSIRGVLGDSARLTIALNLHVVRPADPESRADREAARQIDAVGNRIFLDPIMGEGYPQDLLNDLAHVSDFGFVRSGDERRISAPPDVLGINYYNTSRVRGEQGSAGGNTGGHGSGNPWVGAEVAFLPEPPPHTEMGWNIDPSGLTELLVGVHERFPYLPLIVTENGAAFDDVLVNGRVHDEERIDYVKRHIAAVGDAQRQGVDVRAYFLWSFLDNFEWAYGYSKRFGIVHVDYETQERTLKDSGRWYRNMIRSTRGE